MHSLNLPMGHLSSSYVAIVVHTCHAPEVYHVLDDKCLKFDAP